MQHWSEFLGFAVAHAECMRYTQISLDPIQLMQAMQAAQQQAAQYRSVLAGTPNGSLIHSLR